VSTYRAGPGGAVYRADQLIGIMSTAEDGALVVELLNTRERLAARQADLPQSCQDANGEACPPHRCEISGPHYVTHPEVKLLPTEVESLPMGAAVKYCDPPHRECQGKAGCQL